MLDCTRTASNIRLHDSSLVFEVKAQEVPDKCGQCQAFDQGQYKVHLFCLGIYPRPSLGASKHASF